MSASPTETRPPPSPKTATCPCVTAQLSAPYALLPWKVKLTPASAACAITITTAAVAMVATVEAVLASSGDPVTFGLLPVRCRGHDRAPPTLPTVVEVASGATPVPGDLASVQA